ncbi:MAG: hypothetical protein WAU65_01905 [Candidatus Nanoarchaeia archaeon]
MKKIFILAFLLLIFPLVSAIQINMNSNFSQGQTLIAQVSGNFINQIQSQNVFLYNNYLRVSFVPTVQKVGDTFYIYGQLDNSKFPGNYSLNISGVGYMQGSQISHDSIIQNFTITNTTADFSVTLGFVQTDQNFSITVQNLAYNQITISYFLGNSTSQSGNSLDYLFGTPSQQSQNITIDSGEVKPVYFQINNSNQDQLTYATLSTSNTQYQIPVFIPATQSQAVNSNNTSTSSNLSGIQVQPSEASVSMLTNASTYRYIYVSNLGQQNLTNVFVSVSSSLAPYVSVQNQTLNLSNNSSAAVQLNINSGSSDQIINGLIVASSGNLTSYMNLSLNFSSEYISTQNDTSQFQTCSQLNGSICSDNETCSGGQTQNALDGVCCLSACLPPAQANSSLAIIGWVIVSIIIILLIIFFVKKFGKAKRPLNLLDIAKKR